MKFELYGGKNEIGGNKVLIQHEGINIFLDFGMSFTQVNKYFSEFLQPRKCTGLNDFFEMGLLPDIKGLYREDYLKHMGRAQEERRIDAVFLSHAHADHAQYIHFLRKDIPIYCTQATKSILKSLEKTSSYSFSDLITCSEAFTYYTTSRGTLSRVTRRQTDYVTERLYNIMEPGKTIELGSIAIEMIPVDHSLPGACGFILYSDEGNLVYTGDIRFHGSQKNLSRVFVEKAKATNPKWLLCEGTRIDSSEIISEENVKTQISDIISQTDKLVFVEHPIRDLDRVITIYKSSKENNRDFVVTMKLAYLIRELDGICPFKLEDIKILIPKKSWGLIGRKNIEPDQLVKDYKSLWERDFIFHENVITVEELRKAPQNYTVSMNMWEINQLIDLKPEHAIWIKSSCEPFSPDMELDEERKKNWLEYFKITEYLAHASGHASGDEIREMIREINPENVIPIHTEHPEMF